jgi:hypothetical protein
MKLLISLLLSIPLISCPKEYAINGNWEKINYPQQTLTFSNDSVKITESDGITKYMIEQNITDDLDTYYVVKDDILKRELKIFYKIKDDSLFLGIEPINDFVLKQNTVKFKRVK